LSARSDAARESTKREHSLRRLSTNSASDRNATFPLVHSLCRTENSSKSRALATRPKLLLLDEMMARLRPLEYDQLIAFLQEINQRDGVTILWIEHVMRAVMALAHKVIVLHHGEMIAQGSPAHVVLDAAVLKCYLGEDLEL
jgi:branched-chain amino acid transport system ATP-binding protein